MELLYFILGLIFIQYVLPFFDGLLSWLLTIFEVKKAKLGEEINQININMRQANASADEEQKMPAIGFKVDGAENYEEEDDFYEM